MDMDEVPDISGMSLTEFVASLSPYQVYQQLEMVDSSAQFCEIFDVVWAVLDPADVRVGDDPSGGVTLLDWATGEPLIIPEPEIPSSAVWLSEIAQFIKIQKLLTEHPVSCEDLRIFIRMHWQLP